MINMKKFIINEDKSILEGLERLNGLNSLSMTLFVIDNNDKMIGTLTDGDIRRSLLKGISLNNPITDAVHSNFSFLEKDYNIKSLKSIRDKNIKLIPVLNENRNIIDIIDLSDVKSHLPIDAVLMAGGKGERLRPLTLTTPKPLLKMGDKAIIDRNIERLINFGVKNISVTVNYLKEQLQDHYSLPIKNDITVKCVEEEIFLGTIGSLKLVPEFHNDTILVMNSDLLTDIDFEDFYLHFKEHDAMMSAAAIPYNISIPYGIFNLNGRNIKSVSEKPVYNLYANAGIYLIKKDALKYIPEGQVFNATDLIDHLSAANKTVIRYPLTGLWIDIGTPQEYNKAQDLIKHFKSY